jgi:hypothetical protein
MKVQDADSYALFKKRHEELQAKFDHAEGLLKRIREHEHCRTGCFFDENSPAQIAGTAEGHQCCAAIASEPYESRKEQP